MFIKAFFEATFSFVAGGVDNGSPMFIKAFFEATFLFSCRKEQSYRKIHNR